MHEQPSTVALLVIDLQPDFMPGGALACHEGDAIVPGIAALRASRRYCTVVATQDWHPPGHASFASSHPGRAPFETIRLHGQPQVLWPDHCVQGTPGARLGLPAERDGYPAARGGLSLRRRRPPREPIS